MTHVTQVLLNPEKPSAAIVDQPVLSSRVALAIGPLPIAPSMDVLAKTAAAQLGMTSMAFRGTALEAQRALHF